MSTSAHVVLPSSAALIPAAGSGTRLGMGYKALVPVGGISLLGRSIAALAPHVSEVWVSLPDDPQVWRWFEAQQFAAQAVLGGETRQASVYRLLQATQAEQVLIHDAARPFLAAQLIAQMLEAVTLHGAATVALPCADTLVQRDHQQTQAFWQQTLDRSRTYAVQTPQGFLRSLLWAAHQQALAEHWEATDDAGLVHRYGHAVALVPGDARLFKVTTPADLDLAQAFAQVWDARSSR